MGPFLGSQAVAPKPPEITLAHSEEDCACTHKYHCSINTVELKKQKALCLQFSRLIQICYDDTLD